MAMLSSFRFLSDMLMTGTSPAFFVTNHESNVISLTKLQIIKNILVLEEAPDLQQAQLSGHRGEIDFSSTTYDSF